MHVSGMKNTHLLMSNTNRSSHYYSVVMAVWLYLWVVVFFFHEYGITSFPLGMPEILLGFHISKNSYLRLGLFLNHS